MRLFPVLEPGWVNAYIAIVFYLLLTMLFSYMLDKEGFKRGGDRSWLENEDKPAMYSSGFVFLLTILFSIWVPIRTETKVFYIGVVIYIVSVILSLYTSVCFVTASKDRLIRGGVYKFSRNPIYLCNILVILSVVFLSGTWMYVLLWVAYVIASYFTIKVEEKYCRKQYPDEYQEYYDKTPRYILFW